MKAAQLLNYGGNEVIETTDSANKPSLKDGHLLIEVHASSINPIDVSIRAGYLNDVLPLLQLRMKEL